MILFNRVRFAAAVMLIIVSTALGGLGLQQQEDAIQRQRAQDEREFETAANRWMKTPVDLQKQTDTIPPAERNARDRYWDKLIGASAPLSDPNAQGRPTAIGDALVTEPEFGDLGEGVLLIGKFESYRTFLSSSKRSVYTEIQLRVEHVFGHPQVPVRNGDLIDVDKPGGTIITPWGANLSYGLHPEQMGLQPQHVYLIRLGYDPNGNFYRGGNKTGELWDLTDGTVKPGNSLQKARAASGMSEITGLSVDALIKVLDKKYEEYYARGGKQ